MSKTTNDDEESKVKQLTHQCPSCLEVISPIELPKLPYQKRKYKFKCNKCGYHYNKEDLENITHNLFIDLPPLERNIICYECEVLMKHMKIKELLKQGLIPVGKYFECPKCHSKIIIR